MDKEYKTGDPQKVDKRIFDLISEQAAFLEPPVFLLAYKHHAVVLGSVSDGKINLPNADELNEDLLKECRVFSKSGELYIWKSGGQWRYRLLLKEKVGTKLEYYEEQHFMWCDKVTPENNRHIFEANRGMALSLPFPVTQEDLPLKYKVRNYYKFNDLGLIEFVDACLFGLCNKDDKEISDDRL